MLNRKSEKFTAELTDVNNKRNSVTINIAGEGFLLDPTTMSFNNYVTLFPEVNGEIDLGINTEETFGKDFSLVTEKNNEVGFVFTLLMKLNPNEEINFPVFTQTLRLLTIKINEFLKENERFKFASPQVEGSGKLVIKEEQTYLSGSIKVS